MKVTNAVLAMAIIPVVAMADVSTNADYAAGENSQILLTPELRAAAGRMFGADADALIHAVELNMAAYDIAMQTPTGRSRWHGRLVREEVDTNALVKVEVYSNALTGATWRYRIPWAAPKTAPKSYAAAKPPQIGTNGVPSRLAAARARRNEELASGPSNITVVVEANR